MCNVALKLMGSFQPSLKTLWFSYCSIVLEDKLTIQNGLSEHIFRGL